MAEYIIAQETNVVSVLNRDNAEILYNLSKTSVANPSRGSFEKVIFSDQNGESQHMLTLTGNTIYTVDLGGAEVLFTGTLDELVFKINDEYFESPSSGIGGGSGGSSQPSSASNSSVTPTTTTANLLANTSRKSLELFNNTDVDIYILIGAGTASATSMTAILVPNGYYTTENTTEVNYAAASATTGLLHITENI